RLLLSVIQGGLMAAKAPPAELKEVKIGLWLNEPSFPLDPEVRGAIERFAADLTTAGATVTPIPSPVHMPGLMGAYQVLLGAVLGEDMPPATVRGLERMRGWARWQMSRGAPPTSNAAMTLAYTATHREWMAADAVRRRLRHEIGATFGRFDAILAPIAPVTAFPHDHSPFGRRKLTTSDGQVMPYPSMLNWISLATALHLPATAVPAGFSASGLPVGAQLIGPLNGDGRVLALAQAIEENVRGFTAPDIAQASASRA
ncbi:MAG TPA: amidase family protein, partial [Phenylobacterium sp.]|nr:amidase family protein [Phenylobacterium sp.]